MDSRLRLSNEQLEDIHSLCKISKDNLSSIIQKLESCTENIISYGELIEIIESDLDSDISKALTGVIFGLVAHIRKTNIKVSEVIDEITKSISSIDEADDLEKWNEISGLVERLLSLEILEASAKAQQLVFDYEKILVDLKIITDIRPIYNIDHSESIGSIISNSLRIVYYDQEGKHGINVTLDSEDIDMLSESVEKAKIKVNNIKSKLNKAGLKTFTLGEELYGTN